MSMNRKVNNVQSAGLLSLKSRVESDTLSRKSDDSDGRKPGFKTSNRTCKVVGANKNERSLCFNDRDGKCRHKHHNCKFEHYPCRYGLSCNNVMCQKGHPCDWKTRVKILAIIYTHENAPKKEEEKECFHGLTCNKEDCVYHHRVDFAHRNEIAKVYAEYKEAVKAKQFSQRSDKVEKKGDDDSDSE